MRQPGGYLLLSNRDERRSRQPALGPRIHETNGVKYVAPIDGDYGGSWIGVNEHGMSLCLLNRFGDAQIDESREYISRGLLLIELLDCLGIDQLTDRVKAFNLSRFRPFNLLAIPPGANSVLMEWNGQEYSVNLNAEHLMPLSSTSLIEPNIAVERRRQFEALAIARNFDGAALDLYHRSHLPTRGAYSVCMHREGASTVSLSKILVTTDEVLFKYESGPPCESRDLVSVRLPIRQTK
jgi:hypothetical protein